MRILSSPYEKPGFRRAGVKMNRKPTLSFSRVEVLQAAVDTGRAMIAKHRTRLAQLVETGADPVSIGIIQNKLDLCDEVYAEDLAELKRLTRN
jgi:hypothetical protein